MAASIVPPRGRPSWVASFVQGLCLCAGVAPVGPALAQGTSELAARRGRQGLAVLPFTGEAAQARPVEELVLRLLSQRDDVRFFPPERWRGEMRRHPRHAEAVEPDDFVAGARDLNLRAALAGHVLRLAGRRQLVLDLLDPEGGVLDELIYPLPEQGPVPREVLVQVRRELTDAVDRVLGRRPPTRQGLAAQAPRDSARPGAAGPVAIPPPRPTPPESKARAVAPGVGAAAQQAAPSPPPPAGAKARLALPGSGAAAQQAAPSPPLTSARDARAASGPLAGAQTASSQLPVQAADPENPLLLHRPAAAPPPVVTRAHNLVLGVGPLLVGRQLRFSDAERPGMPLAVAPGLALDAWIYPFSYPGLRLIGVHAGLGLVFWNDLRGNDGSRFRREETRHAIDLDLAVPLPRGFLFGVSVGYGGHALRVRDTLALPPALDPLPPSVDYRFVALGLRAHLPLVGQSDGRGQLAVTIGAAYRGLLGAGDIATGAQYGEITPSSIGLDANLGLLFRRRWFYAQAAGQVQLYSLHFDVLGDSQKHADAALDVYPGGSLTVGMTR